MKISIIGPNLTKAGQDKADMHVHSADCQDIKTHAQKYGYTCEGLNGNIWTIDASSERDVAMAVYEDHLTDDPSYRIEDYFGCFYFFPCCKFEGDTPRVAGTKREQKVCVHCGKLIAVLKSGLFHQHICANR